MTDVLSRNNVRVSGKGEQPMLFAHGFGCDQSMWRLLAPDYAKRYRVLLFDLMGMGGSDLSRYDRARYDTLQGHADDVLEILDATDSEKAVFVGTSLGGLVTMVAAVKSATRRNGSTGS